MLFIALLLGWVVQPIPTKAVSVNAGFFAETVNLMILTWPGPREGRAYTIAALSAVVILPCLVYAEYKRTVSTPSEEPILNEATLE